MKETHNAGISIAAETFRCTYPLDVKHEAGKAISALIYSSV